MEKFKVENYEFLVFYFEVDEQIRKNLIKKFIFCQLKLQNIKDYKKYNLFYVYVKELKQYQVVLYLDILPFLFLERNIKNGIEVFVYNS
ncbi:hypothetical protein, partial [Arcobacter sp. CECT 8985]|uniref:hypothetical protein n=1 Tax=Arcobacter sp. CECT 8985 TaxID=1935424 RepID=UPI0010274812